MKNPNSRFCRLSLSAAELELIRELIESEAQDERFRNLYIKASDALKKLKRKR